MFPEVLGKRGQRELRCGIEDRRKKAFLALFEDVHCSIKENVYTPVFDATEQAEITVFLTVEDDTSLYDMLNTLP